MEDELKVTTDATTISADNSNGGGDDVSTSSPPMVVLTNEEASASDDGAVASSTTITTTTTRPITCPRQFFRLLLSTRFQGNESSLPMEMCSNCKCFFRRINRDNFYIQTVVCTMKLLYLVLFCDSMYYS
jgi:hypothetical protein